MKGTTYRWLLLALIAAIALSGCGTLRYYGQAVSGQWSILRDRTPVQQLVNDPATPEQLRERLQTSQTMLQFLERELGLEPARKYASFVDVGRDAVVYNLVATRPLSIDPERWCYPFVGCAPYRGYFKAAAAQRFADSLLAQEYSVHIGKVPAYSTLGWFDDPLLSTFVYWPDAQLMSLLAHEVAHSKVWIPSAVELNEAFASFVGRQAAQRWLEQQDAEAIPKFQAQAEAWAKLLSLLRLLRERLRETFASDAAEAVKLAQQQHLYQEFRQCFASQQTELGGERFRAYVDNLNNAQLAAVSTYEDLVPAFRHLFAEQGRRWPEFFVAVDSLAELARDERELELARLTEKQIAQAGDDGYAQQVQCEPLADHGVNGDMAAAVNDHVRRGRNR